tara:strand:+ start:34497 stop:35039 length:543 start_codon:yes stop_codon:yes gene_type:complete
MTLACGGSESADADAGGNNNTADASGNNTADASSQPIPDAAVAPDANLSDHAFVFVDGTRLDFDEDLSAYDGGGGSRTATASVGEDCPFSETCTTLYVSFAATTSPGFQSCEDTITSVQLTVGSDRFFSFGSALAGCSFQLDVNDGESVVISGLRAYLESNNNPSDSRSLADGEARVPFL